MTQSCGNCRFFLPKEDGAKVFGLCRRYPPAENSGAEFPTMNAAQWCGEFKGFSQSKGQTSKRNTNPKKEDVANAAREILEECGEPLPCSKLHKKLIDRGVVIEGKDPQAVLITMLWRQKDKVQRIKGGGYWLTEQSAAV